MLKIKHFSILNLLFYFIFFIMIIISFLSLYEIINYKIEEDSIYTQVKNIEEKVEIQQNEDTLNTQIIEPIDELSESNPYWDYINMNLINVDFDSLKVINNDVKGWIQVNGTNINYPFVQTNNNDYYLNHSFDKSYNTAGWVFLDYRNDLSNFSDKNTILYAHGRLDKIMFGSLRNILSTEWVDNSNNYIVKLSTEYENSLWQVFSVYYIPTTSSYLQTEFINDDDFNYFINTLIKRSAYNFNTSVFSSDRIITLSTCYDKSNKVVLHAKLIKRETK